MLELQQAYQLPDAHVSDGSIAVMSDPLGTFCCLCLVQYVCANNGEGPCNPGDAWPYGMCTLKKLQDPVKPEFWSTNAGTHTDLDASAVRRL